MITMKTRKYDIDYAIDALEDINLKLLHKNTNIKRELNIIENFTNECDADDLINFYFALEREFEQALQIENYEFCGHFKNIKFELQIFLEAYGLIKYNS